MKSQFTACFLDLYKVYSAGCEGAMCIPDSSVLIFSQSKIVTVVNHILSIRKILRAQTFFSAPAKLMYCVSVVVLQGLPGKRGSRGPIGDPGPKVHD